VRAQRARRSEQAADGSQHALLSLFSLSPVVGGAAVTARLLSPALAAGFRAVLLIPPGGGSDTSCSDDAALPCAARAADVPRALAAPSDAVVGLFLTRKRERALLADGLLHPLPRRGVVALAVDASAPLAPQGPWHALLHKATDQLAPHAQPGALAFTGTRAYAAVIRCSEQRTRSSTHSDTAQHSHVCVRVDRSGR
jgi:hypothetical protein